MHPSSDEGGFFKVWPSLVKAPIELPPQRSPPWPMQCGKLGRLVVVVIVPRRPLGLGGSLLVQGGLWSFDSCRAVSIVHIGHELRDRPGSERKRVQNCFFALALVHNVQDPGQKGKACGG